VPTTTLPSNCFTRQELHVLISRANQLAQQSSGELAANLSALVAAASDIDGLLADLSSDAEANRRYGDVLADDGWESIWVENFYTAHTDEKNYSIKLCQQLLRKDQGQYVVTGRFRLHLGDEVHVTSDRMTLRPLLVSFLNRNNVPQEQRDNFLVFAGVM
jgi:hypothetical protein